MKRIIAIIIGALALAGTGFSPKGIWIIDAESQLTIEASTNVNDFTCKFEYSNGTDTLRYIDHRSTRELRFTRGRITVPIRRFNCGARPISKDFWKALKSETHPNLEIIFVSLQDLAFKGESSINGVVDITLAGCTTRYTICYQAAVKPNGNVFLEGAHTVKLSDFGMVAPQKMKGLIKVKERLKVKFNLVLKQV